MGESSPALVIFVPAPLAKALIVRSVKFVSRINSRFWVEFIILYRKETVPLKVLVIIEFCSIWIDVALSTIGEGLLIL